MSALHGSWDHLGARQALRRLEAWACAELGIPTLAPDWVVCYDIESGCAAVRLDSHSALETLRNIRLARVNMDCKARSAQPVHALEEVDAPEGIDERVFTAMVRLAYGEMCEAAARAYALLHVREDQVAHNLDNSAEYARFMFDSYIAALWSTAHAEYACTIEELRAIMPPQTKSFDVQPPPPSPDTVPYSPSGMPDLCHLVDRRENTSGSTARMGTSKSSVAMAAILNRCTSTSTRGWEAAVLDTAKDGDACMRICCAATTASLLGFNPAVHPAARPTWEERLSIQRTVLACASEPKKLLSLVGCASREAMRLFMGMTLGNIPAVREALITQGSPAGSLIVSPFELSPSALQSAATTLASMGKVVCSTGSLDTLLELNNECFSDEAKRCKRSAQAASSSRAMVAVRDVGIVVPTLLGPARSLRNFTTSTAPVTLRETVQSLSHECFSADFHDMWYELGKRKYALTKLSEAQHRVLHDDSPMRTLLAAIPEQRRMFVQRVALTDPRAFSFTAHGAAEQLGLYFPPPPDPRTPPDLTTCCASTAADLMLYARVASVKEGLVAFSLGERTRVMQIRALAKRLSVDVYPGDTPDAILARIPRTACHLCLCAECRRVANAVQTFQGKDVPFNEVGISAAMLRVDDDLLEGSMRCAKRSSSTLRAAVQVEEDCVVLEQTGAVQHASNRQQSLQTKMRRACKACFEQPGVSMPCGEQDLVLVPVVGRAVQAFGHFYCLCAYCGALCHLLTFNRFDGEVCCMRCDYRLLAKDPSDAARRPEKEEPHYFCRYCAKRDSAPKSKSRWRVVHAPQDHTGPNSDIPPPLRTVTYCSSHAKQWIRAAHRSNMTMAEIFAHLNMRIKPAMDHHETRQSALVFKNIMSSDGQAGALRLKKGKKRGVRLIKKH